jgi:hypothetical protein
MFIVAFAVLLSVAQAEPLNANLACIVDRIPPSVRESALAEAATGEGASVRQAFDDAAEACARERSWSSEFASDAGRIAAAFVIGEEAEAALRDNGIAPDLVHDWFDAQPASVQQNIGDEDSAALLIAHLQTRGTSIERLEANATTLGLMLGVLQMIARIGNGAE